MARDTALLVIYNPVCGHGQAKQIVDETVLPFLQEHGHTADKVVATTHAGHAGEILVQYLAERPEGPLTVVLCSGDGTLHEALDALQHAPPAAGSGRELLFALVPCGTANALYSSLFPPTPAQSEDIKNSILQSLRAVFVASTPRPLTLARTTVAGRTSIAAVVASTALHAAILHDSEALRAAHPGLDRFKLAAQQNIARWYHATATLHARAPAGIAPDSPLAPGVQAYDPARGAFVPCAGAGVAPDGQRVTLRGPFAYFLATANADRLEPAFRIAPHQATFPPLPASTPPGIDVVVLRPLRAPGVADESDAARARFAQIAMEVLGAAYRNGAHTAMRYGADGQVVEGQTEGDVVVEYFRCNGWEWTPVSVQAWSARCLTDEHARTTATRLLGSCVWMVRSCRWSREARLRARR